MSPLNKAQRSYRLVACTMWLTVVSAPGLLAGSFSVSGGFQWWSGTYVYQTTTTTYALTAGARFRSGQYSISLTLPVLFQNSDLVSQTGAMFLPHANAIGGQSQGGGSRRGGGMMAGGSTSSPFESGIGDIFVAGNYGIVEESYAIPSIALTGQVKVPTASTVMNFGTGKWDYGAGLALRKQFGTLGLFADAGYLVIGDPAGADYRDPFTFGFGAGNLFLDGTFSMMLYYQAYTKVLENYAAPQQLSVGLLYQSSPSTSFLVMSSFGLSETTPDFGIAVGVDVAI
jgi:Putative MetA-pathway of phenol degradation